LGLLGLDNLLFRQLGSAHWSGSEIPVLMTIPRNMIRKPEQLSRANAKVVRQAKSKARLEIVVQASEHGETKKKAAQLAGMTEAGVNSLLYKNYGTSVWPIGTKLSFPKVK
jgi:hypothetical protein